MKGEALETGALAQWIVFTLDAQAYALQVERVQEIIRVPVITPVPGSAACVEGVFNLRGRVVPIMDLAKRLGLAPQAHSKTTRVIIVQIGSRAVGLLVDAVTEVIGVRAHEWSAAGEILTGLPRSECFVGVRRLETGLLLALDLERVLTLTEQAALERAIAEAPARHG